LTEFYDGRDVPSKRVTGILIVFIFGWGSGLRKNRVNF